MNPSQLLFPHLLLVLTFVCTRAVAQQSSLRFAGQDCELAITEVSEHTVRVTLTPKGDVPWSIKPRLRPGLDRTKLARSFAQSNRPAARTNPPSEVPDRDDQACAAHHRVRLTGGQAGPETVV